MDSTMNPDFKIKVLEFLAIYQERIGIVNARKF